MTRDHTDHGKWSQAGVPQKGWTCIGIDDLEVASQTCEMCGTAEIQYVHYMKHPEYPEELAVGCTCAENMEQDYVRPREREKRLRTLASRRKTRGRRQWKVSSRGNPYLNAEGYNLVLKQSGQGWQVIIKNRVTGNQQAGNKYLRTEYDA